MLGRRSPVLETLAALYAESAVGKTGVGARDFGVPFVKLLKAAGCVSGDALAVAEADLLFGQRECALEIKEDRRSHDWQRIRVPLASEAVLFALIGRTSLTAEREAWAALFERAALWTVPATREDAWKEFCRTRAAQCHVGQPGKPFKRGNRLRAELHLWITAQLLAWERPCLLRTVSAQIAGNSKVLESAAPTLETLLSLTTDGVVRSFEDLGIEHNPATVRFHGPIRVRLGGRVTDYANHVGESALSESDLAQAETIECDAPRCVTVENATKFHELCRLGCGDVFVFTSYPNAATVRFLRSLPIGISIHHFGDTDPWGFDVLRTLRQSLDRPVEPLHMHFRSRPDSPKLNDRDRRKLVALLSAPDLLDVREELVRMQSSGRKGDYEQETLSLNLPDYPYLGEIASHKATKHTKKD